MKEKIKKYIQNRPLVQKYARLLVGKKNILKLRIKKRIKGEKNTFNIAPSATLYNCTFDIQGHHNTIEINDSAIFNNVTFYIKGSHNTITIADRVQFNRGGSIWVEDDHCETTIGESSTFEDVHLAITEPNSKLSIGKDCMFAYDIDIRTGDSHSIIDTVTNKRINHAQNIIIEDHVWVAAHVSILKGSKISSNSIVATRAVVTKVFEDKNILLAGTPAKKIKQDVDWDRQRL